MPKKFTDFQRLAGLMEWLSDELGLTRGDVLKMIRVGTIPKHEFQKGVSKVRKAASKQPRAWYYLPNVAKALNIERPQ